MTNALISTLVFAVFIMGLLLYQNRILKLSMQTQKERIGLMAEELASVDKALRELHEVISNGPNGCAGVRKVISENHEIAQAIRKHCPQVFQQEPGLVHWLHFNEQFLVRLRDVAIRSASSLDADWLRDKAHGMPKAEIYAEIKRDLLGVSGEGA